MNKLKEYSDFCATKAPCFFDTKLKADVQISSWLWFYVGMIIWDNVNYTSPGIRIFFKCKDRSYFDKSCWSEVNIGEFSQNMQLTDLERLDSKWLDSTFGDSRTWLEAWWLEDSTWLETWWLEDSIRNWVTRLDDSSHCDWIDIFKMTRKNYFITCI